MVPKARLWPARVSLCSPAVLGRLKFARSAAWASNWKRPGASHLTLQWHLLSFCASQGAGGALVQFNLLVSAMDEPARRRLVSRAERAPRRKCIGKCIGKCTMQCAHCAAFCAQWNLCSTRPKDRPTAHTLRSKSKSESKRPTRSLALSRFNKSQPRASTAPNLSPIRPRRRLIAGPPERPNRAGQANKRPVRRPAPSHRLSLARSASLSRAGRLFLPPPEREGAPWQLASWRVPLRPIASAGRS